MRSFSIYIEQVDFVAYSNSAMHFIDLEICFGDKLFLSSNLSFFSKDFNSFVVVNMAGKYFL